MEDYIRFKVFAVEVPGYNERNNGRYRGSNKGAISAAVCRKLEYIKGVLKDREKRVESAIKAVADSDDILFIYLSLPDIAHYLLFKGLTEITYLR